MTIFIVPIILVIVFLIIITASPKNKKQDEKWEPKNPNNLIENEIKNSKIQNTNYSKAYDQYQIPIPKDNVENLNYSLYYNQHYVMTLTELSFYRRLKNITDKLNLTIFPNVGLEAYIKVKEDIPKNVREGYRKRINCRRLDYTIVTNSNCRIVCCMELDDHYHEREKSKKRDKFIEELLQNIDLKLYRVTVPVKDNDMIQIEKYLTTLITKEA